MNANRRFRLAHGVTLTTKQQGMLEGEEGDGVAMAMRVIVGACRSFGATRLIEIMGAHVDSCLYHGDVSIDFAQTLLEKGAHVRVPTTLNVGSVDLIHPANVLRRTPNERKVFREGRALMDTYSQLGCTPTWTCAPYQLSARPAFGEHIAWAESSAIVFANSVLGARTERNGDFIDICSAITGLGPLAGLHTDHGRLGNEVFDCSSIPTDVWQIELTYPLLGYLIGSWTAHGNPVLFGLPNGVSEERLKALGAAAASAGGIALFHAVGVTPEAPTLNAVLPADGAVVEHVVRLADLDAARAELTTKSVGRLDAVSIGTPHASLDEMRALSRVLESTTKFHKDVDFYVSTGRHVLAAAEAEGLVETLERCGVRIIVDTCTYVTSILPPRVRTVMTNSAKWAHYAPANLGIDVAIGTLEECVESAVRGHISVRPLSGEPA